MKVETFSYNIPDELAANTYVVSDKNNNAVVIDPSVDYDGILNYLRNNKLTLKGILLTHGHFDHIRGVKRLILNYDVHLYVHTLDAELLTNPKKNCSSDFDEEIIVNVNPSVVNDGDILNILNEPVKVIHTPYHTAGGVCYYLENSKILFSGDSLFKLTVGRDDLPTSVPNKKHDSLNKIISLSKDTKVYPGHGKTTSIGEEVLFNRFINSWTTHHLR